MLKDISWKDSAREISARVKTSATNLFQVAKNEIFKRDTGFVIAAFSMATAYTIWSKNLDPVTNAIPSLAVIGTVAVLWILERKAFNFIARRYAPNMLKY